MRAAHRNLIENGSMPPNILLHPEELEEGARDDIRTEFEKLGREKRTAVLSGGLKMASVAFPPLQMGFFEQPKTVRDEVLASMGTAESALGLSEFTNYATALANDYGFWEKNVLPLLRLIETALDATLFAPESDRTFGMFDLTQVEALRAGLADKAQIAERLSGGNLHMPPEVSLELCGLDGVPDYAGKDVAFGSLGLTPIPKILEDAEAPPEPVPAPLQGAEDPPPDDQEEGQADAAEESDASVAAARRCAPSVRTARERKARNGRRNREFIEMQSGVEGKYRTGYRSWIDGERRLVLAVFDEIEGKARGGVARKQNVDLQVVLPVGKESAKRLAEKTRKLQVESLLQVWEFTTAEIGIPIFSIDDQAFVEFFRRHEGHFTGEASAAIRRNLSKTLEEGLREGESLRELRARIGQVFDISASSPRTLLTARTTTSSFMSGVRDQMFHLQGIESGEWSTSGDEHVRPPHVVFGEAGVQALGFNFLELTGEAGRLEHPGDTRAPFGQIASCFVGETEVLSAGARTAVRSLYDGQLVTIKTAGGHKLAGTPNHPVLTTRGFVPLGALTEGDHVISSSFREWELLRRMNVDHVVAPIQQVFDSLRKEGAPVRDRGLRVNLYGRVPSSKVDVVHADSELLHRIQSSTPEHVRELLLSIADHGERALLRQGLGDGQPLMPLLRLAPDRLVSCRSESLSFVGSSPGHANEHGLASSPWSDPGLQEDSTHQEPRPPEALGNSHLGLPSQVAPRNRFSVDGPIEGADHITEAAIDRVDAASKRSSDVLHGLSSLVAPDQVLSVDRQSFRGHVFTLGTEQGVYLAGGICVQNCRCLWIPSP